jgi:tetratricopeptide (TPR) repeat protein
LKERALILGRRDAAPLYNFDILCIMSAKSEQLEQIMKWEEAEASSSGEVCTSCGIAAVDDVTLKDCNDGCDLVKYCSVGCQENNRGQHEEDCKKRLTDLRDRDLFTQPDISYLGECPICCLPLSLDVTKSTLMGCCSKIICIGCNYADVKRELGQGLEWHKCAFCREPVPNSQEEHSKRIMKRVKKNDPVAMTYIGKMYNKEGDYGKALEYFTNAAELGEVDARFGLGILYRNGNGAEKDEKKAVCHFEQAAIDGHPLARVLLGNYEMNNCRFERAAKHFIIAANLGSEESLKLIKFLFVQGIVSKEEHAGALRGYQSAVNETKSAEREKAEAFRDAREAFRTK